MRPSLAFILVALTGCSSTSVGRGLGDGGTGINPGNTDSQAPTSTVTNCSNIGDECYCSYASSGGNGQACDTSSIPSAQCCADVGWPDKNLSCSCRAYTCKLQNGSGSDSCQCSAYESGNLTRCTDAVCCASTDTDSCHCGPSITCNSYETQVAACEASVAMCTGSTQLPVASCSR